MKKHTFAFMTNMLLYGSALFSVAGGWSLSNEERRVNDKRYQQELDDKNLEEARMEQRRIDEQLENRRLEQKRIDDRLQQRRIDNERWERSHGR